VGGGKAVKQHSLNSIFDKITKDFQDGLAQYVQEIMRKSIDPDKLGRLAGQSSFDPYMILGLARDCSDEEVKRRFRELARILHPDTSRCQGTEFLFMLVNLSYEQIAKERRWK
jgi:DnaJ-class molecular chaperone